MGLNGTKKVLLITSGQPALNPRLVKEADSLADAGYSVMVLYAYWNDWGTNYDKPLLANRKWNAKCVGGSPYHSRFTYFLSRIIFKLIKALNHPALAVMGVSRVSFHLILEAKKYKADLYIAHNLGALPAAVIAAKKNSKPCGFDAEDFHRNEVSNDPSDSGVIRKSIVEDKYIPQLNYFTTSSLQIASAYKKLFPQLKPLVILNVFNKSQISISRPHDPLKLFWFSQTIGKNRGLESLVSALTKLNFNDFELNLLGDRPFFAEPFIDTLLNTGINIIFHDPIPPDDIIEFSTQFDIGLALEPGFCINNNIALSNKLFTYLQAGLAVIATETVAQFAFMKENPAIGSTYENTDIDRLVDILSDYHKHPEKLLASKQASLRLAHEKYNWEIESEKFLDLIKQTV